MTDENPASTRGADAVPAARPRGRGSRWPGRALAVTASVVLSMVYVGVFAFTAVLNLLNPTPLVPSTPSPEQIRQSVATNLILVGMALFALRSLLAARIVSRDRLGLTAAQGRPARLGLMLVASFGFLFWVPATLGHLLASWTRLLDPNRAIFASDPIVVSVSSALQAGVAEEILALAIPLVLLERLGLGRWRVGPFPAGWLLIGTVLVAARMSYHVYRGWASLQFLPWAVASVVFFYWTRALVA